MTTEPTSLGRTVPQQLAAPAASTPETERRGGVFLQLVSLLTSSHL
jgi:hypothetical protein